MLNEVRLEGFGLFRSARLRLKKQGLVWVCGKNLDTAGASSNGSGKTTLSSAITWCLFGEIIDSDPGDAVIHEGATRAVVELDLAGGWTVRRERAKGAPKLTLIQAGEVVKGLSKVEVQDKIIELIGMDFQAFRNTALYGQNDTARFAHRSTSDVDRKGALLKMMRASILRVCSSVARNRAKTAKDELAAVERELKAAKARLEELGIEALEQKVADWNEARQESIDALKEEARRFKKQAEDLLKDTSAADEAAGEVARLKAALSKAEAAATAAAAKAAEVDVLEERARLIGSESYMAGLAFGAAKEGIAAMDGDRCPVCDNDLKAGHASKHKKKLEKERDEQKAKKEDADKRRAPIVEEIATLRAEARKLLAEAASASGLREELEEAEQALEATRKAASDARALVQRARDKLALAKEKADEVNPHVAYLDQAQADAAKTKALIKEKRAEMVSKGESAAIADFWTKGFSGQGLSSLMLDATMPFITERANHYLETLSDGDITVNFSTQRELKSAKGEYRDAIDITWNIEGVEGKAPSGGQQRKIEIATDLALMDLAESYETKRLSFFWADEVFDGLDAEGSNRVLYLLQELRSRKGSVFVVSHSGAMSEIFEKQICVVKEGRCSRIEEAA